MKYYRCKCGQMTNAPEGLCWLCQRVNREKMSGKKPISREQSRKSPANRRNVK